MQNPFLGMKQGREGGNKKNNYRPYIFLIKEIFNISAILVLIKNILVAEK